MQRFMIYLILSHFLIQTNALADATSLSIKERCDIPGGDLQGANLASAADCAKLCSDTSACKAFVYISGWGKCLLKKSVSRQVTLQMFAARRKGPSEIETPLADHDNKGKDLRKEPNTTSAEACGHLCLKEPLCKSYTYIGGYKDCWLKKTEGKSFSKIFSCGIK